jgi:Carboxypeptidase regulatory-like domain
VISAVALLAVVFIKEIPLRHSNALSETQPETEQPVVLEPFPEFDVPLVGEPLDDGLGAPGAAGPQLQGAVGLLAASGNGHSNGHSLDGRLVLGRILRGDGQPLAGASVTLADVTGQQVDRSRSGEDGSYRLRASNGGTYLLIASAPQLAPNAAMIAVAEAPVHRDVVLAGSAVLRGCVRGADHEPLPGALITLTDVQGDVVGSTTSAADGGFELGELFAGTYTLAGQAPGHQPVAVTVELGDGAVVHQEIVLVGGARVAGVVRAHSDGRPLPEATVTLLDDAGNVLAATRAGEKGDYAFEDLLGGNYTLIASGYAPVATGLRMSGGDDVHQDVVLGAEQ